MLALTVSTAAIWVQARKTEIQARKTEIQARKTEAANSRRNAFIIESYPLLHISCFS